MENKQPHGVQIGAGIVGVRRAELHAVVTRADGTVEDLGIIAATDFITDQPGTTPGDAIPEGES